MKNDLDNWYLQHPEELKGCLLALRTIVLQHNSNITEAWKYRMPFFCYHKKMFCYLWVMKKNGIPYMGFVDGNKMDHPKLIQEKRSRMKILMLDTSKDLPLRTIKEILNKGIKIKELPKPSKKKST